MYSSAGSAVWRMAKNFHIVFTITDMAPAPRLLHLPQLHLALWQTSSYHDSKKTAGQDRQCGEDTCARTLQGRCVVRNASDMILPDQ